MLNNLRTSTNKSVVAIVMKVGGKISTKPDTLIVHGPLSYYSVTVFQKRQA